MRGAVGLGDQDCGAARCGSSICGACSSYGLPAGSSEYSATAGVTSLPYESTSLSSAKSREADSTGAVKCVEVTGCGVTSVPAPYASVATAISASATPFTTTA